MPISIEPPAIHQSIDLTRVIACLAEVENSPPASLGGRLQFTSALWRQFAGKIPYSRAQNDAQAKIIAKLVLADYSARLIGDDINPGCYQLAICWRYGITGGLDRLKKKMYSDYAQRAENLYGDKTWHPENNHK